MEDIVLVCVGCGNSFTFTVAEQSFFRERAFVSPKRCRDCRDMKRRSRPAARAGGGPSDRSFEVRRMRSEDAAPKTGATRSAGGGAGKSDAPRHPAVCTACGAATEVPFVPDGVRPVYCMGCLKKHTR